MKNIIIKGITPIITIVLLSLSSCNFNQGAIEHNDAIINEQELILAKSITLIPTDVNPVAKADLSIWPLGRESIPMHTVFLSSG